jgi:hypothetical protein
MTTQHVPHTPLWRKVLSLPQTSLGWWAVGLSGIFLALMAVTDTTDKLSILGTEVAGGGSVLHYLFLSVWQLSGLAGVVAGLIAWLRRHR